MRRKRRWILLAGAVVAVALLVTAIVDRRVATYALYAIGGVLLFVGGAGGMGGGGGPQVLPGLEREAARVFEKDMKQRLGWQSENVLIVAAGAAFIGLGVLLSLA